MARSNVRHTCAPSAHFCASFQAPLRILKAVLINSVVGLMVVGASGSCQTASQNQQQTNISQDAAALAAIKRSLTAMGGASILSSINDTETLASCTKTTSSNTITHNVRWITAGKYFRYDGGASDPRGLVNGPHTSHRITDKKDIPIAEHSLRAMKPFHVPGLVLYTELNDPASDIKMLASTTVNGISALHIAITTTSPRENPIQWHQEEWFFDPSTGLPLEVSFQMPGLNSVTRAVDTTITFSDFYSSQGIMVPKIILRSYQGQHPMNCTVSSFTFNTSPDSSIFTVGGGL